MDRRTFVKAGGVLTALALTKETAIAKSNSKESKDKKEEEITYLKLQDKDKPTELEQKHVPAIEAPSKVKKGEGFDIKVKVGFQKEHPSAADHWITEIRLFVNGEKAAKLKMKKGGMNMPYNVFGIKLNETSKIEAAAFCNLHGAWITEPMTITVE